MSERERSRPQGSPPRGRQADTPGEIPKPGWRDALLRVKENNARDNLSVVSAGVAFFWFLAVFPALAAAVSIYGLVSDPAELTSHLDALSRLAPREAYAIISDQLRSIVTNSGGALGFGFFLGILISIWSSAKGMKALMGALNIAYSETEQRSILKLNAVALLFTLGAILFGLLCLGAIVALPMLFGFLGLSEPFQWAISIGRWPLLAVFIMAAVSVIYRYAPDRENAKWRWISWGAFLSTLLWIIGSLAFSFYVSNFGKYNETYGSIGAIIILLLWFFLSAYAVVIGAELDAELEHQTRLDTTTGEPRPMGERGAYVADTLGESP